MGQFPSSGVCGKVWEWYLKMRWPGSPDTWRREEIPDLTLGYLRTLGEKDPATERKGQRSSKEVEQIGGEIASSTAGRLRLNRFSPVGGGGGGGGGRRGAGAWAEGKLAEERKLGQWRQAGQLFLPFGWEGVGEMGWVWGQKGFEDFITHLFCWW